MEITELKLRVLSLFSGAGGMDIGMEGGFLMHRKSALIDSEENWVRVSKTGFETVFANDILSEAKTAWTGYFKDKEPDVYHLESIVDMVRRYDLGDKSVFPKDIDVVTGGFPCQDFSVAGKRLGFESNKNDHGKLKGDVLEESRGKLYFWMKRVIDIVQPKMFIAENVKGLLSMGDAVNVIRDDFSKDGYYVVEPRLLKAWEYGVPEKRERIIFIGIRRDALKLGIIHKLQTGEIDLYPEHTHGHGYAEIVTCRDVLSSLREPSVETDDLSQMCFSTAKWLGRGKQGQTEISLDGLGPTIRSEHHGNIEFRRLSEEHGGRNTDEFSLIERRLTPRECALIQTFPPDYEFVRKGDVKLTQSGAYKIIGNAVPPVLAYRIALKLVSIWADLFEK